MSVDREISDTPRQLDFWDNPSLDPTGRLKAAMREALKDCGLSRDQVADQINELARREGTATNGKAQRVTVELIEKWVSPSAAGNRIPVQYLPMFCRVTGSLLPLTALAAPVGADVIHGRERAKLAWAEAEIARRRTAVEARKLAQEIGL